MATVETNSATLAFVDNGDGTITDLNTGLMWEKKNDAGGLHDKDNLYRWSGDGSQETIWESPAFNTGCATSRTPPAWTGTTRA